MIVSITFCLFSLLVALFVFILTIWVALKEAENTIALPVAILLGFTFYVATYGAISSF